MRIAFVGPTVPDAAKRTPLLIRPPARQGDVRLAVDQGATVICLIDGVYENVPAVWHKEILFALSRQVKVIGAASMGGLRAVECETFGMVGIGRIFEDYRSGIRSDDADVALLHGPEELGYPGLTVPLVNVDATLDALAADKHITLSEFAGLRSAARALFFKHRTWKAVCETAGFDAESRVPRLKSGMVDQKRLDALAALRFAEDCAGGGPVNWAFHMTPLWGKLYLK